VTKIRLSAFLLTLAIAVISLGYMTSSFAGKNCEDVDPRPRCADGGGGGGGGKVLDTLYGAFDGPGENETFTFSAEGPLLETGFFSMASNDEFDVTIVPAGQILDGSEPLVMNLGGLLVRVKGGKATGVVVFLSEGDFAQSGSPVYETDMLPIDPAVRVLAEDFTLHVHADHVLLGGKGRDPIGWINIGDLVLKPTPPPWPTTP
jgi:hypothetical protein